MELNKFKKQKERELVNELEEGNILPISTFIPFEPIEINKKYLKDKGGIYNIKFKALDAKYFRDNLLQNNPSNVTFFLNSIIFKSEDTLFNGFAYRSEGFDIYSLLLEEKED